MQADRVLVNDRPMVSKFICRLHDNQAYFEAFLKFDYGCTGCNLISHKPLRLNDMPGDIV